MAEPKKETVRIALPPRPEPAASAPRIAKRDTARIVLPTRTPVTPVRRLPPKITPLPASDSIPEAPAVLPRRPAIAPPVSSTSSALLQPLPKPPGIETHPNAGGAIRPVAPVRSATSTATAVDRGPKKETARISVLPRPTPLAAPAINMTKTQPLLVHPVGTTPVAPVVITSKPVAPVDAIPRSLAWGLVGISALIFLIQIWNYIVS
ncbi:MAG TPA: hypothetical protein VGH00_03525 [Chthoniobacterales bacterium]